MTMQVVTSQYIQTKFGEVAEMAKFREPITITQYGRPTLMLLSYDEGMEAIKLLASKRASDWLDGRAKTAPQAAYDLSLDELDKMIDDER